MQQPPKRVERRMPRIQRSDYRNQSNLRYLQYGVGEMPTYSNNQVHETRPTANYSNLQPQSSRLVTYADVGPPAPIRVSKNKDFVSYIRQMFICVFQVKGISAHFKFILRDFERISLKDFL